MTPTARIEVIGSRQAVELTAIVDTGFNGDLCLPTHLAIEAGLDLIAEQLVELADGTQKNELVFAGSARFLGGTHPIQIMLTESEDALIGTRLLNLYELAIEFPGGQVVAGPRSGRGGRRRRP